MQKITHIDLFSGIGGFSLALDRVFGDCNHTFVEIDPFCQEVLRKHWPKAQILGDIHTLTTYPISSGHIHGGPQIEPAKPILKTQRQSAPDIQPPFILTGGFPCQPFSQAGPRKGTEDDRHLWPEMLRVIQLTKPQWVIAENVRGLLTIGGGCGFRTSVY